ncbi:MAG TPA: hypothetical protein VJ760_09245 [Nitrospiraceae bacterium]|nr:hypothetical protein [Nitrospiraceae bacterium]
MSVVGRHATMEEMLLPGRSDQRLYGFQLNLLKVKVFAITHFTSPADLLAEYSSIEAFSSGISPARLV